MQVSVEQEDRVGNGMHSIDSSIDRNVVAFAVPTRKVLENAIDLLRFTLDVQVATEASERQIKSKIREIKHFHVVRQREGVDFTTCSKVHAEFPCVS